MTPRNGADRIERKFYNERIEYWTFRFNNSIVKINVNCVISCSGIALSFSYYQEYNIR